jgi:hypothetical protein
MGWEVGESWGACCNANPQLVNRRSIGEQEQKLRPGRLQIEALNIQEGALAAAGAHVQAAR